MLIVFWASWADARQARPARADQVYEKHKKRGLEIIGVNLDNESGELDAFLEENQLTWPQILRAGRHGKPAGRRLRHHLLPTMFLIDAEGKVVHRNLRTAADVERQLEKTRRPEPASVAIERKDE